MFKPRHRKGVGSVNHPLLILPLAIAVLSIYSCITMGNPVGTFRPKLVSFPTQDGGLIYANLYGKGSRGVVLAHGGRFTKESWDKQAQVLSKSGFRVLAIDFRGRGRSRGSATSQTRDDGVHYD